MSAGCKQGRKQELAIAFLLSESTHALAAKRAGIAEATLQRWLKQPDFQAAYRAARQRLVERAVSRLQQVADQAVETLARNLSCGHPATELRAALGILAHVFPGTECVDQTARLNALEQNLLSALSPPVPDPRDAYAYPPRLSPTPGTPGEGHQQSAAPGPEPTRAAS